MAERLSTGQHDFVDRLNAVLFRSEFQSPGGDPRGPWLNYAELMHRDITGHHLPARVAAGEVMGWYSTDGCLHVPRSQFLKGSLDDLHPAVQALWDTFAPSLHSKLADLHTPRPAAFWTVLAHMRIQNPYFIEDIQEEGPRELPLLDFIHGTEADSWTQAADPALAANIPPEVMQSFADVAAVMHSAFRLTVS